MDIDEQCHTALGLMNIISIIAIISVVLNSSSIYGLFKVTPLKRLSLQVMPLLVRKSSYLVDVTIDAVITDTRDEPLGNRTG
jgi:hypothetical protein